jgi:hypothetical protein
VFLELLPSSAIKMVANSLGELFKFDPNHPTGHYKLNLADTYQFMLAQKLQARLLHQPHFFALNLTIAHLLTACHFPFLSTS